MRFAISALLAFTLGQAHAADIAKTDEDCVRQLVVEALEKSEFKDLRVTSIYQGWLAYTPIFGDDLNYGFDAIDQAGNKFNGHMLLETLEVFNDARTGELLGYTCVGRFVPESEWNFVLTNEVSGVNVYQSR